MRATLKYPGAKWAIADWIISRLPAHHRYVEPYFGSGAILLNKPPLPHEVANDLNHDIVNFFEVVRTDADRLAALLEMTPYAREEYHRAAQPTDDRTERARRFVVHTWQSFGRGVPGVETGWRTKASAHNLARWRHLPDDLMAVAARLRNVQVECRPALDVIQRYADADTLIYADPPYPRALRRRFYPHELTDADHGALLDALSAHPGPVAISGYHCALYDARLADWTAYERAVTVERGARRIEVLWVNRASAGMFLDFAS